MHSCACSAPYNGLYCFPYTLQGRRCEMTFTSVAGHLMELDFTSEFKKWWSCDPVQLYNATIHKSVPQVIDPSSEFIFAVSQSKL